LNGNFLVSVVIITYNQDKYIESAILGILAQVVYFPVEVIIADDCSSDITEQKVFKFLNGHYENFKIKYYKHKYNKGASLNAIWAHSIAQGKYVAVCEGDDYWTYPFKLSKQVEFLEKNQEFSFCFHSVEIKNNTKNYKFSYPKPKKNTLSFIDILLKHYIPTCSIVYRRSCFPNSIPRWVENAAMTDIPFELFLAYSGKVFFFDKIMAVYRLNQGGLTQNLYHLKNGRKSYDYLLINLRTQFGYKYCLIITLLLIKNKLGYIKDYLGLNKLLKNYDFKY